jgi:hypothetical protein
LQAESIAVGLEEEEDEEEGGAGIFVLPGWEPHTVRGKRANKTPTAAAIVAAALVLPSRPMAPLELRVEVPDGEGVAGHNNPGARLKASRFTAIR